VTLLVRCIFCGREVPNNKILCEGCSSALCEICGSKLARGYCAICGRIICDECSEMIGYARVCKDCLREYPEITDYESLRRFQFTRLLYQKPKKLSLKNVLNFGKEEMNEGYIFLRIGLDDFDSPYGLCTTYLGAHIALKLTELGFNFVDYPYLVRLNPNIPWKTRGNAAISLSLSVSKDKLKDVRDIVLRHIHTFVIPEFKKTQPAVAFYYSPIPKIPYTLKRIYYQALRDLTTLHEVIKLASSISYGVIEVWAEDKSSRGIIGALAAVGAEFKDYTFELLAYRKKEKWAEERFVDARSVKWMDDFLGNSLTFDNIDGDRILITPRGPDPVLFGIRGDIPEALFLGFNWLKHEDIDLWCLYKTNQGTNAHIVKIPSLCLAKPYQTIRTRVRVDKVAKEKGKVILNVSDNFTCAKVIFYRPAGKMRKLAEDLKEGDWVEIVGTIVDRDENCWIINAEEFIIIELSPLETHRNPFCPKCGRRLISGGKDSLRCPSCGFKMSKKTKLIMLTSRKLKEGFRIIPPSKAHRHLTMPLTREHFSEFKRRKIFPEYLIHPFCGRSKIPLSQLKRTRTLLDKV